MLYEKNFSFNTPKEIIFGRKSVKNIGRKAKSISKTKNALLITDKGVEKAGVVSKVNDYLKEENMKFQTWTRSEGEPKDEKIEQCYEEMKDLDPGVVIGLGGGSTLDTAKIVASLMTNRENSVKSLVSEETGTGSISKPPKPLIGVETAAGTGSEISKYAVVQVKGRKAKVSISDSRLIPKIAILDPELTVSLPRKTTAWSGIDAFTHLIEASLRIDSHPLVDALAQESTRIIPKYLPRVTYNGDDIEARTQIMFQSGMGGLALNYAGTNEGHTISHLLGWKYGIPHGIAQGLVLPYCSIGYSIPVKPKKIEKLARSWWGLDVTGLSTEESCERVVEAAVSLLKQLGLPWKLSQVDGIEEEDIPEMASILVEEPFFITHEKPTIRDKTEEDFANLLERIYRGKLFEF